jgi:hypothetical protein
MHAIKVDQPSREGVVTSVSGALLRIRWATGDETTMVPGPGSVEVVGKVRKASGKKTGTKRPAPVAKKSTKAPATKANKRAKK